MHVAAFDRQARLAGIDERSPNCRARSHVHIGVVQHQLEKLAFRAFAGVTSHPRLYEMRCRWGWRTPAKMRERFGLDEPPARTFRQLWSHR